MSLRLSNCSLQAGFVGTPFQQRLLARARTVVWGALPPRACSVPPPNLFHSSSGAWLRGTSAPGFFHKTTSTTRASFSSFFSPFTPFLRQSKAFSRSAPLRGASKYQPPPNTNKQPPRERNKNVGLMLAGVVVAAVGVSYLSVPLYRMFCQQTGYGGTVQEGPAYQEQFKTARKERPLRIQFSSQVNANVPWRFFPLQQEVKVVPGQSVLIFYRAQNLTEEDVVGIASYNVVPAKAALYFHKIECFCFDEQLLPAKQVVDLPVLFLIDADFADDPDMADVTNITLNYTFFRSKDFENLVEQV
ncbi:Cytochrome c oxidase assembly protein cox11, mitochondrial [Balamuthia mandrillaris]